MISDKEKNHHEGSSLPLAGMHWKGTWKDKEHSLHALCNISSLFQRWRCRLLGKGSYHHAQDNAAFAYHR
jgi:hypothetical protein